MRRRSIDPWRTEYERHERRWWALAFAAVLITVALYVLIGVVAVHFVRKWW